MAFRKTRNSRAKSPFKRAHLDTREMLLCKEPLHFDVEATSCNTAVSDMVEVDLVAGSSTFGTSQGIFHKPYFIESHHWAPPADVDLLEQNGHALVHLFEALIVVPYEASLGANQINTRTPAFVPLPWADGGAGVGLGREHYNVIWQKMSCVNHWQESLGPATFQWQDYPHGPGASLTLARTFARPKRRILMGEREGLYYVRSGWYSPFGQTDILNAEFDVFSNVRYRYGIRPKFL